MIRKNAVELSFFTIVILFCLFMIWKIAELKLILHDLPGPGFYPLTFIIILLICTIVLLVQSLTSDYVTIFSPYIQGQSDDQLTRKLAGSLSKRIGHPTRVKTKNGVGRFSAIWKGMRSLPDGKTLMVVCSNTNEIPNLYASNYALSNTDPLARLFFFPDTLALRKNSEFDDAESFFSHIQSGDKEVRIGIRHIPAVDYSVESWLAANVGQSFRAIASEDYIELRDKLLRGEIDALICSMDQLAGDQLVKDGMKLLTVFSDTPARISPDVPPVSWNGACLSSGNWAGLALPKGVDKQRRDELEAALSDILEDPDAVSSLEEEGVPLDYLNRQGFAQFLGRQKQSLDGLNHKSVEAEAVSGKFGALVLAIVLTFLFGFGMKLIGFPITAIIFLLILMSCLWTKLTKKSMLFIAGISVGLSVAVYLIFGRIFYISFPNPMLFGG